MNSNDIGTKIKALRLRKGVTQIELSESLNVANTTISNWETGRRLPSITELKRIASFFDVSLSTFEPDENERSEDYTRNKQIEYNQSIEYRPIGFKLRNHNHAIMLSSFVMIALSSLTGALMIAFLLIGMLLFMWQLFTFVNIVLSIKETNYKKVLLPVDDQVLYIHNLEDKDIHSIANRFRVVLFVLIIANITLYYLLLFFGSVKGLPMLIVLSVYALSAIIISLVRYQSLFSKHVIYKSIDYFSVKKDLKNRSIVIGFIVDLVTFFIVSMLISLFNRLLIDAPNILLIQMIALSVASLSYYALILFYEFLAGFSLYSITSGQRKTKLN